MSARKRRTRRKRRRQKAASRNPVAVRRHKRPHGRTGSIHKKQTPSKHWPGGRIVAGMLVVADDPHVTSTRSDDAER